ncbi:MAG: phosphatidate cytidylyltransferase [Anaerolineaceae bacterium]
MLSTRIKSILVFVPLILAVIAIGGVAYDLFFLVVILLGARELHRLFKTMGYYSSLPLLMGCSGLFVLQRMLFPAFFSDIVLLIVIVANAIMALVRYEKGDNQAALSFAMHVAGSLYLGWLGAYFISLRHLANGGFWTLVIFVIIWLIDMFAYLIGVRWGKHKLSPRLSPKKSWEGFAAGVVAGALTGILLSFILKPWLPEFHLYKGLILGLVIAVVTPIGDVFISMLKRIAGVKDSGMLIPGHGGILDRIDTWMWAAMLGYYLLILLGTS